MCPITKLLTAAIIATLPAAWVAGCTYTQPGVDEKDAATIEGYVIKYHANYLFPFFWPSNAMIIVGDDEESLRAASMPSGSSARKAIVSPGYRCIAVLIDEFGFLHSCPMCFDVEPAETYQIRVHRVHRPWYDEVIDRVSVVTKSGQAVVAKQDQFCAITGPRVADCSKCPLQHRPDQAAAH